jgi:hypothetical protein
LGTLVFHPREGSALLTLFGRRETGILELDFGLPALLCQENLILGYTSQISDETDLR